MDRRNFTRTSLTLAGSVSLATLSGATLVGAQTPVGSPEASPVAGSWQSTEDPITITWDTEIFGDATTSGVTGEWCVLRIPDIEHFLSFIIKLEEKYPTDEEALRDLVENDPQMEHPQSEDDITRLQVTEDNGAYGVLYQPVLDGAPDTWSYSEFIPSEDGSHRTIQLSITSRRSKLDREMMEKAVSSVTINGEQAVRAIDVTELFDQVEALEADVAE